MAQENKKSFRITRTALIAAIIVLMVGITTVAMAYSGAGNWFLGLFSERSDKELTSGQQQLIEDETVSLNMTVSSGDVKVTLESAILDDYTMYIILNIEAPEGSDLSDVHCFGDFSYDFGTTLISYGGSQEPIEDNDGRNNAISMLITTSVVPSQDNSFSFKDATTRTLRLKDICSWSDGVGYIVLYEGEWEFELVFGAPESGGTRTNVIDLISEPVYCSAKGLMGDSQEILITSFELRSFGGVCTYEQSPDEYPEALDIHGIEIIMKDGSVAELYMQSGRIGTFTLSLNAPIVLEDVDFVRLPNGITLYANQ